MLVFLQRWCSNTVQANTLVAIEIADRTRKQDVSWGVASLEASKNRFFSHSLNFLLFTNAKSSLLRGATLLPHALQIRSPSPLPRHGHGPHFQDQEVRCERGGEQSFYVFLSRSRRITPGDTAVVAVPQ